MKDREEGGEEGESSATDMHAAIKASVKDMEKLEPEQRGRLEDINLRCLALCIAALERVNGVCPHRYEVAMNAEDLLDPRGSLSSRWTTDGLRAYCHLSETPGMARARNDPAWINVSHLKSIRTIDITIELVLIITTSQWPRNQHSYSSARHFLLPDGTVHTTSNFALCRCSSIS